MDSMTLRHIMLVMLRPKFIKMRATICSSWSQILSSKRFLVLGPEHV